MYMKNSIINLKRVRACVFCRVSQADEPRGSAAAAAADSDSEKYAAWWVSPPYTISHVPPAHANSFACSVSSVRSYTMSFE